MLKFWCFMFPPNVDCDTASLKWATHYFIIDDGSDYHYCFSLPTTERFASASWALMGACYLKQAYELGEFHWLLQKVHLDDSRVTAIMNFSSISLIWAPKTVYKTRHIPCPHVSVTVSMQIGCPGWQHAMSLEKFNFIWIVTFSVTFVQAARKSIYGVYKVRNK